MINIHQTCPKHYMFKHSDNMHTLKTPQPFYLELQDSKAFCQMLWLPWSPGPCPQGSHLMRYDPRSRYPMHFSLEYPKALKKAEGHGLSAKRGKSHSGSTIVVRWQRNLKRWINGSRNPLRDMPSLQLDLLWIHSNHSEQRKWKNKRWIIWAIWSRSSLSDRPLRRDISEAMLSMYRTPEHWRNSSRNVRMACNTISNSQLGNVNFTGFPQANNRKSNIYDSS